MVTRSTPAKGVDFWLPTGKHWFNDGTPTSKSSGEVLIDALCDKPKLWTAWRTCKLSQGGIMKPIRRSEIEEMLLDEMIARRGPSERTSRALGGQLKSLRQLHTEIRSMERVNTGDGFPALVDVPGNKKKEFANDEEMQGEPRRRARTSSNSDVQRTSTRNGPTTTAYARSWEAQQVPPPPRSRTTPSEMTRMTRMSWL